MRVVQNLKFERFDWDPNKRQRTLVERGLDFADAAKALLEPHIEVRSDRFGEVRVLAICDHSPKVIAVVYTPRGELCRIISVRPARKNEQREFRELLGG